MQHVTIFFLVVVLVCTMAWTQHPQTGELRIHDWELEVHVIVDNRETPLRNLLQTLARAKVKQLRVPLFFHLEANQSSSIVDMVQSFKWEHGLVAIHSRLIKGGLITAVVESWFPRQNNSYAIILEDDIQVSVAMFEWLEQTLPLCSADANCAGVSLYTPRLNELRYGKPQVAAILSRLSGNMYRQQLPCSWGAAYRGHHWQVFRGWMAARVPIQGLYYLPIAMGRVLNWRQSWKKFFTEMMLLLDWHMLYPNLHNQTSFSTNTLAIGAHIVANDPDHHPSNYTVPLAKEAPKVVDSGSFFNAAYQVISDNVTGLYPAKAVGLPRNFRKACTDYNPNMHRILLGINTPLSRDGLTLVMSHMPMSNRQAVMFRLLRHYCKVAVVARIVVLRHSVGTPAPMRCPGSYSKFIHFSTVPKVDSLANRFAPSELIITEAVATLDDDILVPAAEVKGMLQAWKENPTMVVGPFCRWIDISHNYTTKGSKSVVDGCPFILTKFHVSHYSLFWEFYCNSRWERERRFVTLTKNAEDLLYMKVATNMSGGASALVYKNEEAIIDYGTRHASASRMQGLHGRPDHYKIRTKSLHLFDLDRKDIWSFRQATRHGLEDYRYTKENVMNAIWRNATGPEPTDHIV